MTTYDETSCCLVWEEPEDNGGAEIKGYVLEKRDTERSTWSAVMKSDSEEYTAKSLTTGKSYNIRVAAKNEVGQGPWVDLPEPFTAKSMFGKLTSHCVKKYGNF